jgi:hypothetical protein
MILISHEKGRILTGQLDRCIEHGKNALAHKTSGEQPHCWTDGENVEKRQQDQDQCHHQSAGFFRPFHIGILDQRRLPGNRRRLHRWKVPSLAVRLGE